MSSLSNIRDLIAQLETEDQLLEKETEKHFEDQHIKYKDIFEKLKHMKDKTEKCIDDFTKGLDYLVSNQHTIEQALKQTDNLDGLSISPEQQENAIDLVNKMTKFINNTELITSPNPVSLEQIQKDVASHTSNVAEELKDGKADLRAIKDLSDGTQLLNCLTTKPTVKTDPEELQNKLYTITEDE